MSRPASNIGFPGELGLADDRARSSRLRRGVGTPRGITDHGGNRVHGGRAARGRRGPRARRSCRLPAKRSSSSQRRRSRSFSSATRRASTSRRSGRRCRSRARLLGLGLPLTLLAGFGVGVVLLGALSWPEALPARRRARTDRRRARTGRRDVAEPPSRVRQGLNVESGLNDGICVPLFFVVLAIAQAQAGDVTDVAAFRLVARGDRLRASSAAWRRDARGSDRRRGGRRGLVSGTWLQIVPSPRPALAYSLAAELGGSRLHRCIRRRHGLRWPTPASRR